MFTIANFDEGERVTASLPNSHQHDGSAIHTPFYLKFIKINVLQRHLRPPFVFSIYATPDFSPGSVVLFTAESLVLTFADLSF